MTREVKSVGLMLVVFSVLLFGVHKADTNTQDQIAANQAAIAANSQKAAELAWTLCDARNSAIVKSNIRWHNEKLAWEAAAKARGEAAKLDTDPAQKKIDTEAAATYSRVADSITPYTPTDCGAKP